MTVLARVGRVFNEAFAVPAEAISRQTLFDDVPKWDSLGHLSMVAILEREFGVQFEVDEVMEMASVQIILNVLAKKGIQD
ncbi:MAG: acyl carrier protein [Bryobacteraceae bacterium]|jgi:acyl carrier protein